MRASPITDPARYLLRALDAECAAVRSTAQGGRRNAVRDAALRLSRRVVDRAGRAWGLDSESVERALLAAALACGLGERRARTTIRDAWRDGRRAGGCIDHAAHDPPRCTLRPQGIVEWWATCERATDDPLVRGWLSRRGLDADEVSRRGLVRSLPSGPLPPWATYRGRCWRDTGHRALCALYGPTGEVESVRARLVYPTAADAPKALPPTGYRVRGTLLADDRAVALLRGEEPAVRHALARGVTIGEGEPDWLALATSHRIADPGAPVVFGVVAGSWAPEVAARVPSGARVRLRVHDDAAGARYAAQIAESLAGRCAVLRAKGAA